MNFAGVALIEDRHRYVNKKLFTLKDTELRFGYFYDGHWKIYRPFADKKVKWVPNNVPIDVMEGKSNIINVKNAFINKSDRIPGAS